MDTTLEKKLAELSEDELTEKIIIPLIENIHEGRIEFTHSSIEAGRDIVSFGNDNLDRSHILCVQVKAKKISYGASFGEVIRTTELAKREGVTLLDGTKQTPHEVWFITSHPFPESNRRQVADSLKSLDSNNIKFVSGEELCRLLYKHCPNVISKFLKQYSFDVVSMIKKLSAHNEGRAFSLPDDKLLQDFYVAATISPSIDYIWKYIINDVEIDEEIINVVVNNSLLGKDVKKGSLEENILESINCDSNVEIKYPRLDKFLKKYNIIFSPQVLQSGIVRTDKSQEEITQYSILLNLQDAFNKMVVKIRNKIKFCPNELKNKIVPIREIFNEITDFDIFLRYILNYFEARIKILTKATPTKTSGVIEPIRIKISNALSLLKLSTKIIIEGKPGLGKTTLLKILTINLLESNKKAVYLPCYSLSYEHENLSLKDIVYSNIWMDCPESWKCNEIILIIDGLDEAIFDLSRKIDSEKNTFKAIIISKRTAFKSFDTYGYFTIGLSPFNDEEREEFFNKWLYKTPQLIEKAKWLCKKYVDIDTHTRIPLISTTLAVLLENGYTPRTRTEIYNYRLELLLWKWDLSRGVKRIKVDNPSAKLRLLKVLAYTIHNSGNRKRTFSKREIFNVLENHLGNWGYRNDFDDLMDDLVVNNGVLYEEGKDTFSFGHLSFQEHLVGEYIREILKVSEIASLLHKDWWSEPLKFYASNIGDITPLLTFLIENEYLYSNIQIVYEMIKYAPYTSPGAVHIVNDYINEIEYDTEY